METDLSQVCRCCLQGDSNVLLVINDSISEMFQTFIGIKIDSDDRLPKLLCTKCADELKAAADFHSRALQTQSTLLEYCNSLCTEAKRIEKCSQQIGVLNDERTIQDENCDQSYLMTCYICDEKLSSSDEMSTHKQTHFRYKCETCKYCYQSYEEFEEHAENCVCANYQKILKCHICNQELMYPRSLRHHLRIHTGEKPCLCPTCGLKFREEKALINHIRSIHTKEKRFKCAFCPKAFTVTGKRRQHERIHTGEKPYECNQCSRLFATRCALTVHIKRHNKQILYKCTIIDCEKGFYSNASFKRHTWSHNNNRPHECSKCHKAYLTKQNLMAHHKSAHSQIKDQICHICNKQFFEKSTLNRHLRSIHKTEPKNSKKPIAVYAYSNCVEIKQS